MRNCLLFYIRYLLFNQKTINNLIRNNKSLDHSFLGYSHLTLFQTRIFTGEKVKCA